MINVMVAKANNSIMNRNAFVGVKNMGSWGYDTASHRHISNRERKIPDGCR